MTEPGQPDAPVNPPSEQPGTQYQPGPPSGQYPGPYPQHGQNPQYGQFPQHGQYPQYQGQYPQQGQQGQHGQYQGQFPGQPPTQFPPQPPGRFPGQPGRRSNTIKWVIFALAVVLLLCVGGGVLAVVAIGRSERMANARGAATPVFTGPSGTRSPSGTARPSGTAGPAAGPVPSPVVGPIGFGTGYWSMWDDRVQASVVSVARFTPSSTADGFQAGQVAVKVTVKITNGSAAALDLSLATVDLKWSGLTAQPVYDSSNGIGDGFDGSLASGEWVLATYGFSLPSSALSRVDVEVQPGWDYTTAVFEGPVS